MTVEEFRLWIRQRLARESLRMVGDSLGVTAATVSRWRSGSRIPCRRTLFTASLLTALPSEIEVGLPYRRRGRTLSAEQAKAMRRRWRWA